ncbi:CoA transferase [Nakamurella sp. YIM 132087]|uniref:CoA transferase n=2 Tax=Nakamurella alba TaxID=2665158 RepID=A0A7K1FRY8_9ACTN|nr:CoA transferase [Nakamurella alba]
MAGPWATQLLGDLGADVIKIEPPGGGDQARRSFTTTAGDSAGDNAAFRAVNRNKRSVVIDLRTPEGQAVLHRLARSADVVVENFRPGVAERLGADAATLHTIDPRLVVLSLSGFGTPDEPDPDTDILSRRPGFDLVAQAMTGLMSITGTAGGEPVKVGVPITDLTSGMFGVIGLLAALRNRELTGRGDHVRTSLYQAGLALLLWESASFWTTGDEPGPTGAGHRLLAPYEALRTKDSHVVVAANNDKLWRQFLDVLGLPALAGDPRFATNADRLAHRSELAHALEARLITRTTDDWVDALTSAGLPAAPVRTVGQALSDPHTRALKMVGTVEHPVVGTQRVLGVPFRSSAGTSWPGTAAPAVGQDTRDVLSAAGFSDAEIETLATAGTVVEGDPYPVTEGRS